MMRLVHIFKREKNKNDSRFHLGHEKFYIGEDDAPPTAVCRDIVNLGVGSLSSRQYKLCMNSNFSCIYMDPRHPHTFISLN